MSQWMTAMTVLCPAGAGAAVFMPLGVNTFTYDVSNDANVVAGRYNGQGAIWRPGLGWTVLTPSDGFGYKTNRDGSVVAGFYGSSTSTLFGNQAFRWTPGAGVVGLNGLPGGNNYSKGEGLSGDGNVVVGAAISTLSQREAFRWTAALGMVGLGAVLGNPYQSEAHGANFDGSIVVGDLQQTIAGGFKTFRWNNGVVTYLDGSPASGGGLPLISIWGVSGDDKTIYGVATNPGGGVGKAARWTQAIGGQLLGGITPTDGNGEARDSSADGSIITGYSYVMDNPAGTQTAFIWDPLHGTRSLKQVLQNEFGVNLTGWTLNWAYISDDGKTVGGVGLNPANQQESWLVIGIPEPASLAGAVSALTLALSLRRRHFPKTPAPLPSRAI